MATKRAITPDQDTVPKRQCRGLFRSKLRRKDRSPAPSPPGDSDPSPSPEREHPILQRAISCTLGNGRVLNSDDTEDDDAVVEMIDPEMEDSAETVAIMQQGNKNHRDTDASQQAYELAMHPDDRRSHAEAFGASPNMSAHFMPQHLPAGLGPQPGHGSKAPVHMGDGLSMNPVGHKTFYPPSTIATPHTSKMVDCTELEVPDFSKILQERALAVSGNKAALIARLEEDNDDKAQIDELAFITALMKGLMEPDLPSPESQTSAFLGPLSPSAMSQPPRVLEPGSNSADGMSNIDVSLIGSPSTTPNFQMSDQGLSIPVTHSPLLALKSESSSSSDENNVRGNQYREQRRRRRSRRHQT